jgi:hypothetical protein
MGMRLRELDQAGQVWQQNGRHIASRCGLWNLGKQYVLHGESPVTGALHRGAVGASQQ